MQYKTMNALVIYILFIKIFKLTDYWSIKTYFHIRNMKGDEIPYVTTKLCSLIVNGNGVLRYILPPRLNILLI